MTAYVYVLHFSYFFISYQFFSIVVKIQYTYSWKKFQLKKGEYFFFITMQMYNEHFSTTNIVSNEKLEQYFRSESMLKCSVSSGKWMNYGSLAIIQWVIMFSYKFNTIHAPHMNTCPLLRIVHCSVAPLIQ